MAELEDFGAHRPRQSAPMPAEKSKKFYAKRDLAARYAASTRSIERWVARKRFPPPDIELPNGHKRWSDATIEAHEKASAVVAAALPAKL